MERREEENFLKIVDFIQENSAKKSNEDFDSWVKENNNYNDYKQIKKIIDLSQNLKSINQLDKKKALQVIQRKVKLKKITLSIAKISAIIILPLIVTLLLLTNKKNNDSLQIVKSKPGLNSEVQLILKDGTIIEISDSSRLQNNNNVISANTSLIKYKKSNTKDQIKKLEYNTIKVPKGKKYSVILSDGSKVILNSDSEFKYPLEFSNKLRKVYLKGEGFFEVAHNQSKPFYAIVGNNKIKVLGTKFNINAYTNQNHISTTLVEGAVKFISDKQQALLKPNQQCVFNTIEKESIIKNVNVAIYTAWLQDKIILNNKTLEELMNEIERSFDIKVFYLSNKYKGYKFRGVVYKSMKIEEVLQIIFETANIKYRYNKKDKSLMIN